MIMYCGSEHAVTPKTTYAIRGMYMSDVSITARCGVTGRCQRSTGLGDAANPGQTAKLAMAERLSSLRVINGPDAKTPMGPPRA